MSMVRKQRRAADIARRIGGRETLFAQCVVLDCSRPPMAREGSGLHRSYCSRHVEHYRRHGSYAKPSYTAGELVGHRRAALRWLQGHAELPEVRQALSAVKARYSLAGRPVEAFRLAGLSPADRANAQWARLAQRAVEPLSVLAVWLAVCLCHRADPQPERKIEYRWVQAAKVLHRMSGGSHKRWERATDQGTVVQELHRYPASRGRVLRHLGEALAAAGGPLEGYLERIEAEALRSGG